MRTALRYLVVTAASVLLLCQAVLAVALMVTERTDHRIVMVTGGSMEPAFSVGDALIMDVSDPENPAVSEVITYASGPDELTTHRVLERVVLDTGVHYRTKGDANRTPDPDLTPAGSIVGFPRHSIPYGAYLVTFMLSPTGLMLGYGPGLALIAWAEAREIRRILSGSRESRAKNRPARGRHANGGRSAVAPESQDDEWPFFRADRPDERETPTEFTPLKAEELIP